MNGLTRVNHNEGKPNLQNCTEKKGFVMPTKSFVKIGITKIFCYNIKQFGSINKMFRSINKTFRSINKTCLLYTSDAADE